MWHPTFAVLAICSTMGCVGPLVPVVDVTKLSLDEETRLGEIRIYHRGELDHVRPVNLGQVEGVSCKNKIWHRSASKDDAIKQAQFWAMKLGADGVVNLVCGPKHGTSTVLNCWQSVTCSAMAVKIYDK